MVGTVEFLQEESTLAYWPTQGARVYQAVAAVGISIVSGYFAFVIAKNRPLGNLIGEGDSWNTAAALAFLIFSLCLLAAIPMYLRGSAVAFVLDSKRRCLRIGRKHLRDLGLASVVTVLFESGFAGEYSGAPTWSVCIRDNGKRHVLPLLTFDMQEEANRVAREISDFLGLPVSS